MLWQRGLIGGSEGNLSVRLGDGTLLATPAGGCKGQMQPDDLVKLDLEGHALDFRQPSSEILMHLRVYRRRKDCQAVVHAHPLVATAFGTTGQAFPDDLMPEAMVVLGPVITLPFAMPGTAEVPDGIEPHLDDHKTFLLSNHGALTLGRDLPDACERMETLERMATVVLVARLLGDPQAIPAAAFEALSERYLHGRLE